MQYQTHKLADFTSFRVGGPANLLLVQSSASLTNALNELKGSNPPYILGFGTNCLASDEGLDRPVIIAKGGNITVDLEQSTLTADAGVWWDDLVLKSIDNNLWGLELMSGIPGSVGGAVVGNIAAYGQKAADTFISASAFDSTTGAALALGPQDMGFAYRQTNLPISTVIVTVTFQLSASPTTDLAYDSALKVADDLGRTTSSLQDRRLIILEARRRSGSLFDHTNPRHSKTCGSFFKNPMVNQAQLEYLASFEEQKDRGLGQILKQNKIHGDDQTRVSAAHVMLAAGFKRGQTWGSVRLHPDHVLKIENTGGATAQQIYDVAQIIQGEVKTKLSIDLEPEVKILGNFSGHKE